MHKKKNNIHLFLFQNSLKRKIIYFIIIMIIAYLFCFHHHIMHCYQLNKEIVLLHQQIEADQASQKSLSLYQQQQITLKNELDNIYQHIHVIKDINDIIVQLTKQLSSHHLHIIALSDLSQIIDSNLKVLPIELTLTGSYPNLVQFFIMLANSNDCVIVHNIILQRTENENAVASQINIHVILYYPIISSVNNEKIH